MSECIQRSLSAIDIVIDNIQVYIVASYLPQHFSKLKKKNNMSSGAGIQELMAAETRASQIVAEARMGECLENERNRGLTDTDRNSCEVYRSDKGESLLQFKDNANLSWFLVLRKKLSSNECHACYIFFTF